MGLTNVLIKLIQLPYIILKAIVEYYTIGTVYSRTNQEFQNSLFKNVYFSVVCYISKDMSKDETRLLVYKPLNKIIKRFKNHPIAAKLNNFCKKFDEHSIWIHQVPDDDYNEEKSDVLVYLHGGGYMINIVETQFVFPACLYYAMSEHTRKSLSILVVDYSLTLFGHTYPTQLGRR